MLIAVLGGASILDFVKIREVQVYQTLLKYDAFAAKVFQRELPTGELKTDYLCFSYKYT